MPKYSPSDDGKVIDGKIVVFLHPPGQGPSADSSGSNRRGEDDRGIGIQDSAPASAAGAGAKLGDRTAPLKSPSPSAKNAEAREKQAAAAAQAASLESAAQDGVPFCEECEKARQEKKAESSA